MCWFFSRFFFGGGIPGRPPPPLNETLVHTTYMYMYKCAKSMLLYIDFVLWVFCFGKFPVLNFSGWCTLLTCIRHFGSQKWQNFYQTHFPPHLTHTAPSTASSIQHWAVPQVNGGHGTSPDHWHQGKLEWTLQKVSRLSKFCRLVHCEKGGGKPEA